QQHSQQMQLLSRDLCRHPRNQRCLRNRTIQLELLAKRARRFAMELQVSNDLAVQIDPLPPRHFPVPGRTDGA
ncbi:MAG: hypothetical protein WBR29_03010, partial [Gammaproteobacteria bacterium]